jgi:5-methyltetrahydropteroyltriglutamate--homocysteine methyltransferase
LGWSPARPAVSKSKGALKRRIEEATKFIDLDRLCLSPQCGFASAEESNILA